MDFTKRFLDFHKRQKRNEERQLQTKLIGDVRVLVKDPDFREKDKQKSSTVWPTTLPPRILQDRFAIQANLGPEIQPTKAFKTDYTTFTYFITSLLAPGVTTTSTDIIISSNVITEDEPISPTASWDLQSSRLNYNEIKIPPSLEFTSRTFYTKVPSNLQITTKTYYTTSTFYSTYLQNGRTYTKTRTLVRSEILEDSPFTQTTSLISGQNEEIKYLSLGSNIYGKIKTLFATYTYTTTNLQGNVGPSTRIITQYSTSLFSDSNVYKTTQIQLNPDQLTSLKLSYIKNQNNYPAETFLLESGQINNVGSGVQFIGNDGQIISNGIISSGSSQTGGSGSEGSGNVSSNNGGGNSSQIIGDSSNSGGSVSSNNNGVYYEINVQQGAQLSGQAEGNKDEHTGQGGSLGTFSSSNNGSGYYETSNQQQGNEQSSGHYGSGSIEGSSGASSSSNGVSNQQQGNKPSSDQYGSGSNGGSSGASSFVNDGSSQHQGNEQSSGQYGSGSSAGSSESSAPNDGGNGYYETINQQQGNEQSSGQYGSGSNGGNAASLSSTNGYYETNNQQQGHGQYGSGSIGGGSIASFSTNGGSGHYEPSNQHQVNGQYEGGLSGQSVTFSVRPGQNHDYKDGTSVYKETYVPSHTVVLGSHYETHTDTSFITTKPIKSSSSGIYLNSNYLISLKKSFLSSSSSSATESKSPIWDINIPTEGPTIIIKPSTVTITETQSAPPASVSPPVIDSGSGSSSSDATSTTPYPPSGGGGVINAVVGGIAEGLGGVFGGGNNNVGGLKVDLGPVLDAVATLLRGPIRSAIANRRSDVEDFSTSREFQNIPRHTQVFVSELTTIPFAQRNIQARNNKYEFVPLPLEKGGSRSDGDLPRSEDSPELHVPQNIYDEINKHRASKDEPVYLDKDKLIINDHVIHTNDPYIIDVLNRFEQGHLFGEYRNKPMAIKILPGKHMLDHGNVPAVGNIIDGHEIQKMLNDEKVRNSPLKTKNSRHSIRSPQISNGNKHIQKPERPQITTYRNPNLVPQKHFKKNVPPYPNKNPGFRTLNQKVRNPVAQKGRPNGPRTKLPHPKNQKTPYSQSNIEKAKITYTRQQNLKRNPTSKRQKFSDVFPGGPHTSNGFKPNFRPHPKDHNPNLDKSIKPQGGQDIPLFPHNKRPNEANLKQTSLQTPKSIKTSRGPVILGPKRPKKQILKIPLNQRPNLPQSSNSNLKNDFLRRPVRPHPSIKLSKTKNKRLPHLVRDGHKQKRIPRPRPTGYIRGGGRPNNVSPNTDIIEEILPSHATDDKNKIQFGFTPKIQNPFLRPGIVEDTNLTSHDYNPQERVEIIKGLIEPNSHKTIRPSPSSNDQLIATGYGVVVDGNNVRDMTITDSYGGVQIIQTKIQDRPYNLGNTALPLRPPPKVSKLDYQGWNTEQKDSVSVIRPTSSFSFQSSNKKEAPKTVTYANEWSVYRPDQSSVIDFVPQKRPKLNTNFDREWTVRDTILRPSRTSKFTPPNTRGYNNEWSEVQPFNPNLYESIKSKNKLLQKNILSRHPFPNGGLQGEQPPHNLITEHQYIQATATNSANIIVASTLSPSTIVRDSNDESGFRGSNGNILSIFQETPKIPETPKKHEPLLSSTHEFQFVPNTTTPTQDTPHPVVEPATIKNEPGYLTTKRSIAKPSLWDKNPFITSSETLLPSIEQVVDTQSNFHYSSIAQNRQTTRPLSSFASDSNTFINIFPSSTVKKDKSTRLSPHIEPDTGTFVNIYPASTSSKIAESYNKATNNVEPGSGNFINTYPSVSTKTIPSRNPAEDKSDIENFKHLYPLPTTKREESSSLTPYTEPDVGTFINIYPSTYSSKKPSITQPDPDFDSRTSINTLSSSTSLNHPNPSLPHVEPNYYPGAYNGIVTSSPLKKVISTDLPPGIEPDTGTFINIFPASTSKTAFITEYHGYVDSDTIRRNENIKEAHEFGVKISPYDDQRQFENDYQQNFNIFYDNSGDPSYVYEDDNSGSSNSKSLHDSSEKSSYGQVDQINDTLISQPPALVIDLTGGPTIQNEHSNLHVESQHDPQQKNTLYTLHDTHKKGIPRNETYPTTNFNSEIIESKPQSPAKENQKRPVRKISQTLPGDKHNVNISNKNQLSTQKIDNLSQKNYFPTDKEDPKIDYSSHLVPISGFSDTKIEAKVPNASTTNIPIINDKNKSPDLNNQINFFENDPSDIFSEEITPLIENKDQDINLEVDNIRFTTNIPYTKDEIESQNLATSTESLKLDSIDQNNGPDYISSTNTSTNTFNLDKKVPKEIDVENDVLQERVTIQKSNNTLVQQGNTVSKNKNISFKINNGITPPSLVTEGESLTAKTSVERNNDLDSTSTEYSVDPNVLEISTQDSSIENLHQSQQNTNIRPENLRPLIDDFYRNGNDRVKSNHRSVYLKDPKESLYVNSNEYGTNSGNYKNEYDYEEITKQFEAKESKLQSNNDQRSTFVYSSSQDGNRNNYGDQYDWIPTDSRYDNFPETPFYSNPDYFNERYDKNFYIDTEYDGDSNNFDKIIVERKDTNPDLKNIAANLAKDAKDNGINKVTKLHSGLPSETKLNENDQYGNTENTGVPQFFGPTIPNFITTETTIDLDNRDDFSNTVDILDSFKDKNNSTLDYENPSNNINIKFNEASVENSNNNNSGVNELTKHANLQKGEGVLDSISIGLNDISLHDDKNNVNDSKHNGDTISTKDKSINTDSDVVVSSTESNGVIPGISNYDTEYPTGWDGQDNYYANYEDSNDGNILDVSRIEGAHGENTPVGSIKVEHTESPKYGNKDNSYGSNKYPVQKEDNVSLYPSTISTSDNEDYIELINEQEDKNSVDIAYIGSDSFRGSEPNQYQNGEVPPFGSEGNTHINELENEHHKSLDNKLNEVNEHIEALGNASNEHNEAHNNMLDAINSQNALLSEDSLSNTVNIVDESNKDPLENTENKVTVVESENDPRLSTIFAPKPQLLYPSVTVKDSNKPLVIIGPQVPNENLFPAPPHIIPSAIDKQRKPVVVYGPQENPNKHIQIHPSNNNPNPNFIGPLRFNPNFIGPFNIPENYENIPAAPGGFEFVGPVVHGPVRFNPKEPENIIEKTQFNSKPEIIIGIPSSTLSSTTTTTAAVEEISSSPSSATTLKSENKVSSPIIEFKEIDEGRKIGSKYKINIRPSSRPILDVFKRRRSSTTTQSSSSLDTTTNDTPRGISFGGKYSPKYTIIRRSTTPSIVTARVPSKKIAGFFIPRSNRTKSRIEKVLPNKETKITFEGDSNSILQTDAPGVIRDQKLNNIDGAIVESIPGHSLSAEETDPETRCQNACGENELCKIKPGEGVVCKCRPGFGRVEGSSTKCEKSKSFAIEVITTSESEEIKIVKLSPKEVEKAVADSYRKNIKELYFGSQITSIKVGNNTKRNIFFGGEKNLTHDDEMSFSMIVHIADDGKNSTEERLKSVLETPIKDTKLPLGADVTVSRVTIEDFDECTHKDHNDCSDQAVCHNIKGSYTCICKEGYHDLSGPEILSGRVCLATTTACDLCNGNGNCIAGETVTCECQSWFAGKNCQINMKLLLIVGCVSVGLMLVIACGVSCFCCKDGRGAAIRSKQNIPSPYGTGIGPMPPMRGHGVLMDPHGTMKSRAFVPRPYAIRPKRSKKSSAEGSSYNGSTSGGGSWQATYNGISGADSTTSKQSRKSGGLSSGIEALNPAVLIPRAKVKSKPFEDFLSEDEASSSPEANRALSEHTSLASRHRRRSIPFIIRSSRSERGGSIDPLLDGSFSDDSNSANRTLRGNTLRSVASETFEVPVMRTNTQITSGSISVRSLRSHATSDGGRTMAERDGGSSFVISASRSHQLYRLHDSDGSLDSL